MRNPIMIGDRVYLRAIEEADAEVFAEYNAAETETFWDDGRYPLSPFFLGPAFAEAYGTTPPDEIEFAVCLREDDRCIGMVSISEIDWFHRTGETGSWIGPVELRGQGYGPEAKHLLLEYCFDRIHLEMLYSCVWEPNTRSAAAIRRQGYQYAGRVKRLSTKDRRPRDMLLFDLSRDEWLAARDAWREHLAAKTKA